MIQSTLDNNDSDLCLGDTKRKRTKTKTREKGTLPLEFLNYPTKVKLCFSVELICL